MSITKVVRFEVFKRDKFICSYCGKRPPDVILEVDHVVPRCKGGGDEEANLVTSCFDCNRGKAGRPLGETAPHIDEDSRLQAIQEAAERMLVLRQQTAAIRRQREAEDELIDSFHEWWIDAGLEERHVDDSSVRHFAKHLTVEELSSAVYRTAGRRKIAGMDRVGSAFRYFCGICWNVMREKGVA